jgi:DNA-binding response OmpR family regulator
MAKVVTVNLDAARVEGVLSKSTRRVTCREAQASSILARGSAAAPDLVVLGGEASDAADVAESLIDDPVLQRTPLVAWGVRGSLADTSRLVALGVRVVTGDEDALRAACEEALDAREGRTMRVDAPTELQGAEPREPHLHGRRIVVADDDPAITWFFADLLRAQGCDVAEVTDGEAALDRARRMVPDLVFSDIRMPRLDGVNLCRILRADPILADVPIVLLSWKDDWLREAEGLGLEASAYLGKRSTPEEVLIRVHEVLEPHARLERRMQKEGPVRGRLDGTAPYRLLRLACATHADSRLTLRCTPNTYEVRIRDGQPRSATRLTADAGVVHGTQAIASLLGERGGRFTLSPERAPIDPDLSGSLHQQIAACVARARGATSVPRLVVQPAAATRTAEVSPPSAPPPQRPAPVEEIPIDVAPLVVERPLEAPARTVPLAPRPMVASFDPSFAPRVVTVTPRATAERTLPLARPVAAPRPVVSMPPATSYEPQASMRRSWGVPLRWVGVAAVAVLGLVVGAGVRALRAQPAPLPPPAATAAAVVPPR